MGVVYWAGCVRYELDSHMPMHLPCLPMSKQLGSTQILTVNLKGGGGVLREIAMPAQLLFARF